MKTAKELKQGDVFAHGPSNWRVLEVKLVYGLIEVKTEGMKTGVEKVFTFGKEVDLDVYLINPAYSKD